jgi:hypothetical protein
MNRTVAFDATSTTQAPGANIPNESWCWRSRECFLKPCAESLRM